MGERGEAVWEDHVMPDAGCRMQDAGCGIRDAGCRPYVCKRKHKSGNLLVLRYQTINQKNPALCKYKVTKLILMDRIFMLV